MTQQQQNGESIAFVYKFNYEMNESLWTANIAGFTKNEAMDKLQSLISNKAKKITSIEQQCRLDAISDPLIDEITEPLLKQIEELKKSVGSKTDDTTVAEAKKSPGRPKKVK